MLLNTIKEMLGRNEPLQEQNSSPRILIVEDDIDQMNLLVDCARSEIKKLLEYGVTNDEQKQALKGIKVTAVSDIESLQKAVSTKKTVVLAIIDCNIPDTKGGEANDQFVTTNHVITGQHRSVDLVTEHLPDTPITVISSLNRFQKTISLYYQNKHDLSISFISKSDELKIRRNIGFSLRQHLK